MTLPFPILSLPAQKVNSLVVCVEYDDFLDITLPRNCKHFDKTLVVTTHDDVQTQAVTLRNGCECFATQAFYRDDAMFNKGAAVEEGFDVLGRSGWICIWDADVLMPRFMPLGNLEESCLYTPIRRILEDPTQHEQYMEESRWSTLHSPTREHEFNGYFQLFHASVTPPPWYSTTSGHAGLCDSDFSHKFPPENRRRLPFEVLHLGAEGIPELGTRVGENWAGRVSARIDMGEVPQEARRRRARVEQIVEEYK